MNSLAIALQAALSANPRLAAQVAAAISQPKPGSKFAKRKDNRTAKPKASSDRKTVFAAAVVSTFAKQGLAVTPNVDVFTYDRWIERGFKPVGPSVRVKTPGMNGKGMPLWHRSQVEPIGSPPSVTVDPAAQAALDAEYGATA